MGKTAHILGKMVARYSKISGKIVAKTLLTKQQMVWLEYLYNTKKPVESIFHCRFCFQLCNRLQSFVSNRPLLSEEAGYFIANYICLWK